MDLQGASTVLEAAAIFPPLVQRVHADLQRVNWQSKPVLAWFVTFFVSERAF
jgi:hypothetical protein